MTAHRGFAVRRCADCAHVQMPVGLQHWGPRCSHPDNSNIIHHGGADCQVERGDNGNCGLAAIHFTPRPLAPPKRSWFARLFKRR